MQSGNLFHAIPARLNAELFDTLVTTPTVRIKRIVSEGHTAPDQGWYDQEEQEWVIVLQGAAVLTFAQGGEVRLEAGDYINIPAHCLHRVSWTDPQQQTVWLAVFYPASD